MKNYLLIYANEHLNFRLSEFKALNNLFHRKIKFFSSSFTNSLPFVHIQSSNSQDVVDIVKRSILVKFAIELWAKGRDDGDIINELKRNPPEFYSNHRDKSFRFKFYTFGKTLPEFEKHRKIDNLDFLPLEGKVDLQNPENIYYWCECDIENSIASDNHMRYMGPLIAYSQRSLLPTFKLNKRKYISNTSMDPILSFLMCNIAQCKPCDLVIDPFVGTGSLLVSAAQQQAFVMGVDAEKNLLMARGKSSRSNQKWKAIDETVSNNLAQYGLDKFYIDVVLGDSTRNAMWRDGARLEIFDAIVTDPPYGIRESVRKTQNFAASSALIDSETVNNSRENNGILNGGRTESPLESQMCKSSLQNDQISPHINNSASHIYQSLIQFALHALKPGGRLVYWLPYARDATDFNLKKTPNINSTHSNCNLNFNGDVGKTSVRTKQDSNSSIYMNDEEVSMKLQKLDLKLKNSSSSTNKSHNDENGDYNNPNSTKVNESLHTLLENSNAYSLNYEYVVQLKPSELIALGIIPQHPIGLKLESCDFQFMLGTKIGRFLICVRKDSELIPNSNLDEKCFTENGETQDLAQKVMNQGTNGSYNDKCFDNLNRLRERYFNNP